MHTDGLRLQHVTESADEAMCDFCAEWVKRFVEDSHLHRIVCTDCIAALHEATKHPINPEARLRVEAVARDIQQADSTNLNLMEDLTNVLADDAEVDLLAEYVCGDKMIPPRRPTRFEEPPAGTIARVCANCMRVENLIWDPVRSAYFCHDFVECYSYILSKQR